MLDVNKLAKGDRIIYTDGEVKRKYLVTDLSYLPKWIANLDLKQEKWLYMFKDNKWQFVSCEWDEECGHSVNFKRYSDKGTCFVCDLKEIFNGKI